MPGPNTTEPATTPDAQSKSLLSVQGMERKEIIELSNNPNLPEELRIRLHRNLDINPENAAYYQSPEQVRDDLQQQALLAPYKRPNFGEGTVDHVLEDAINKINDVGTNVINQEYDQVFRTLKNYEFITGGSSNPYFSSTSTSPVNNVSAAADPVNLFNGNFVYSAPDFQIDGAGIDFVFARTYSQLSFYQGALGFNWDHSYNLWLRASDDGKFIYRSNGALGQEIYRKHEQFDYWIPPDGANTMFSEENGSYQLKSLDGSKVIYQPHQTLNPAVHMVDRIENRFGNYLQFFYVDGLLRRIQVNQPERVISFQYDSENRIISIGDFTGRIWRYDYDDLGDLVAATTPATSTYKKGLTTCYEYSTASYSDFNLQHNLISIIDADGQIYLENEYGAEKNLLSYNRVLRQRQGNGDTSFDYADVIEDFDFAYPVNERPTHQTIVTERDGRQIRHLFNQFGNMIFSEEYARINGVPKLVSVHYRYNKDGNLTGMISPLGVITQYLYGRDFYQKKFPAEDDYRPETDSNLTPNARRKFSNLLAVVKRGRYYNVNSLNLSGGIWSASIFPDVFQTNETDVIQKFTYEPEFSQLLTASDSRFTESSDPEFVEGAEYHRRLTKYRYSPGAGHQNFYLAAIESPTPVLPDGALSEPIKTRFQEYDEKGRLIRLVAPNNLQTVNSYLLPADGISEGFLQTTVVDPGGFEVKTGTERDELGRVVKEFRPKHFESMDNRFFSTTEYNELNQTIKSIGTAPFSVETDYAYNRTGNAINIKFNLKDQNNLKTRDFEVNNRYDEEFNLREQQAGDIANRQYKQSKTLFDRAARPFLIILPAGRKNKTYFNERSLVSKTIADYGGINAITKNFYDADGRLIKVIDARGLVSKFGYDALGRLTMAEDALGNKIIRHYDKIGNILVECFYEKNENGAFILLARHEFAYDELGRNVVAGINKFEQSLPISASQLADSFVDAGPGELLTVQFFYSNVGKLRKVIDQSGREFISEFDVLGRVTKKIDPNGNELLFKYDQENNIVRLDKREVTRDKTTNDVLSVRYFAETYEYDELHRLIEEKNLLGSVKYKYDSRGNPVEITDSLDNKIENVFDIFSRAVKNTRFFHQYQPADVPAPVETFFAYNLDDNKINQTDALGRVTNFRYDGAGRLIESILPDDSKDSLKYDASGNLIEYRDRNGLIKLLAWDKLNRNIELRINTSELENGLEIESAKIYRGEYDSLGRLKKAENDFVTTAFIYNSLNHLLSEITSFKEITGIDSALRFNVQKTFNNNGALINLVYPSGRQINYARDVLDRIVKIEQLQKGNNYPGNPVALDNLTIAEIDYEGLQRKRISRSNDVSTEYKYDAGRRTIEIKHSRAGDNILTLQFLHDALGNLRQKIELSEDFQSTQSFKYDSLSRLFETNSSESTSLLNLSSLVPPNLPIPDPLPDYQARINQLIATVGPQLERKYSYDLNGNRILKTSTQTIENYQTNRLDQSVKVNAADYQYDKNGNLIEEDHFFYKYDHQNQLAKIEKKSDGQETRFFFDYFGRRCLQKKESETEVMIYDGHNLLEEYDNANLKLSVLSDTQQDGLVLSSKVGNEFYLLPDLTRSIRYVFKEDQKHNFYRYDEFGNLEDSLIPVDNNSFRFAGKRLLTDVNKYDFVFRSYDPSLGKFIQRDPQGYVDGTNLYAYVSNNPMSYGDQLGLERHELANTETIKVKENIYDWRPPSWGTFEGVLQFALEGGQSEKAGKRRLTLTEHQTWAKEVIDRGWGCTACHVSVEVWNRLGPKAINLNNMMPYDWAIDREGFNEWTMHSAQARFFVESMMMIANTKFATDAAFERNAINSLNQRIAPQQRPTATIRYTEAMSANPNDANFLRFNAEWAQTAGPLKRGYRIAADGRMRARARTYMDRTGFNRTGTNAMHPLDSVGNPFVGEQTQIGSTYYFGNSTVNSSFGSQLGHELNRLGVELDEAFDLRFEGFPDYSTAPPTAPPSSPPNL